MNFNLLFIIILGLVSQTSFARKDDTDSQRCRDMAFLPLHPGYVTLPPERNPVNPPGKLNPLNPPAVYRLTNTVDVGTRLVTLGQWIHYMGSSPKGSLLRPGPDGKRIRNRKRPHKHPVGSITWYSALVFCNEMSIAHGLEPVYDLSELEPYWEPGTSAEDGTLRPRVTTHASDDVRIKINAPRGNIYKAKGYRLLTLAEQRLLRKDKRKRDPIFGHAETLSEWTHTPDDFFTIATGRQTNPRPEIPPLDRWNPLNVEIILRNWNEDDEEREWNEAGRNAKHANERRATLGFRVGRTVF